MTKKKSLKHSQTGQITIFFSTVVVIMITLMAFIINIGIFVKAKINLQNATDAAAYAGASVQARQLTNIGYLNWEMRNTYKEWMFKYYVLGGLNLRGVSGVSPPGCSSSLVTSGMDFTMCPYQTGAKPAVDSYNFPSVCVDFAGIGSVGLCTKYLVPGLPRFKSSNVLGMDETTNAFVDTIVSQKSSDCTKRSELNFFTANLWAFNVIGDIDPSLTNINSLSPEIAANRSGAFPKAFELALRIRSLEAQVNRAAISKVCIQQGASPDCDKGIESVISTESTPSNERIYKAFFSGYRNLGSFSNDELRNTFTLTEISPQEIPQGNAFGLSSLLIPSGSSALTKRYLDLKIMPVNYSTFYTAFTANKGNFVVNVGGSTDVVASEGQCTATKMGLPIPGYPMGFVKNPDVLTYYAVKAEARFIGLFNPFDGDDIKLTAYAAAKPFGGRIGPMTFNVSDETQVFPRTNPRKSSPFMLALDTQFFKDQFGAVIPPGTYKPGVPLPLNIGSDTYWTSPTGSNIVGGFGGSGASITFGIPNMIYDYPGTDPANNSLYYSNNEAVQSISTLTTINTAGLYNKAMFDKLSSKLVGIGSVVSTDAIDNAILMARAPTLYDAHNYLIPTPEVLNADLGTDSFGSIVGNAERTLVDNNGNPYDKYSFSIYAPIFSASSTDSLFKSATDITAVLNDYLKAQEQAIVKYVESMSLAAQEIYKTTTSSNTGQDLGLDAARGISDIADAVLKSGNAGDVAGQKPTCASIAGQFAYYYTGNANQVGGDTTGCPTPFKELMISSWNNLGFSEGFAIEYVLPKNLKEQLFSAYRPGREHDAPQDDGVQENPVASGKPDNMIRNSYSTKFVSLSSLTKSSSQTYAGSTVAILSEGNRESGAIEEIKMKNFKNPLQVNSVDLDLTKVKY